MDAKSLFTDLRSSFGGPAKPSDGSNATTAQKSTPKRRMTKLLPEYAMTVQCSGLGITVRAALPPEFQWDVSASYDAPLRNFAQDTLNSSALGRGMSAVARAGGISMVTQTLTAKFWNGSSSGAISLPVVLQAETDEVEDVLKPYADLLALVLPRTVGNRSGSLLQSPGPYFDLTKVAADAGQAATNAGTKALTVAGSASMDSVQSAGESALGKLKALGNSAVGTAQNLLNGNLPALAADAAKAAQGIGGTLEAVDSYVRKNLVNTISLQIGRYMLFPNVVITNVQQTHFVQPVGAELGYSTGNMARMELNVTFEPFFDLTQRDLLEIFLDPRLREHVAARLKANTRAA